MFNPFGNRRVCRHLIRRSKSDDETEVEERRRGLARAAQVPVLEQHCPILPHAFYNSSLHEMRTTRAHPCTTAVMLLTYPTLLLPLPLLLLSPFSPPQDLSPEDLAALPLAATAAANGGSGGGKGGKKNRGGPPPPPKQQPRPAQGGGAKGSVPPPLAQLQGQQQEQQCDQPGQGVTEGQASLGRSEQPADAPGALVQGVATANGRETGQPAGTVADGGAQGQGDTGEGSGVAGAGRGAGVEALVCGGGANGRGAGGTEAGTCGAGVEVCGAGRSLKRLREDVDGEGGEAARGEGAVEEGAGVAAGKTAGGQAGTGGEGGLAAQRQRLER